MNANWIDNYAKSIYNAGLNWTVNDWKFFRYEYWTNYFEEKDDILRLMSSDNKSLKVEGYSMLNNFRRKKLSKMLEYNKIK